MHSTRLLTALALQAAYLAAATPVAPRTLNFDEVAVIGLDGRTVIMHESEYRQLEARHQRIFNVKPYVKQPAEEQLNSTEDSQLEARHQRIFNVKPYVKQPEEEQLNSTESSLVEARHQRIFNVKPYVKQPEEQLNSTSTPTPRKRGEDCEESIETQILTDISFTESDVAMSAVIENMGGSTQVSVSKGYMITDRQSLVSGGLIRGAVKTVMQKAFKLDFDKAYTSSQSSLLSFNVPEGQYGLVVSQPLVRRIEGMVYSGCTESWDVEAFTQDTYSSQSYGDLSWVQGLIRLCNSTEYPVPYCNGDGFHE